MELGNTVLELLSWPRIWPWGFHPRSDRCSRPRNTPAAFYTSSYNKTQTRFPQSFSSGRELKYSLLPTCSTGGARARRSPRPEMPKSTETQVFARIRRWPWPQDAHKTLYTPLHYHPQAWAKKSCVNSHLIRQAFTNSNPLKQKDIASRSSKLYAVVAGKKFWLNGPIDIKGGGRKNTLCASSTRRDRQIHYPMPRQLHRSMGDKTFDLNTITKSKLLHQFVRWCILYPCD